MLRAAARVFFGTPTDAFAGVMAQYPPADLNWREKTPALILLAALLFIGFWPKSLTAPIHATLTAAPAATSVAAR